MADTLPVPADPGGVPAVPAPAGGWRAMLPPQVAGFVSQPALARALPALGTLGAVAAAAWLWMAISSGPNRVLYTSLTDAERAKVVETLAQAEIEDVHRRTSVRPRAARPAP